LGAGNPSSLGDAGGGVLRRFYQGRLGQGGLGACEHFHCGVGIQVQDGDLAIGLLEEQAIEPDLVTFVAGEPGTGVLAFLAQDRAGDAGGVGVGAARNLLGDADQGARFVERGFLIGLRLGEVSDSRMKHLCFPG